MVTRKRKLVAGLALLFVAGRAASSGGPPPTPDYVRAAPFDTIETAALGARRIGIVKGAASAGLLYLDWRVLNRLDVGTPAATALATPCCGTPGTGGYAWLDARRAVPGTAELYYVSAEREGPNYTTVPNCFDDAFVTAAATLTARINRYGADAPAVRNWLATQDAVFAACGKPGIVLPQIAANAPPWLLADRHYQEAAFALYDGRLDEAARRFGEIARDDTSPWQRTGRYLQARAIQRAALTAPSAERYAAAHAAIAQLAAAPVGTYGRGEIGRMRQVLDFNEHPAALLERLDRDLGARTPPPDVAVALKDYLTLADRATPRPEAADWIRTIGAPAGGTAGDVPRAARLAHAVERWRASDKPAWLVAALSLAEPGDAAAPMLAAAAERVAADDPAWLTARYHLVRWTIASIAPTITRSRVDAVLTHPMLARSDRNIFAAIRAQVATDLDDFARHALVAPYCHPTSSTCVDYNLPVGDGLIGRASDGRFVGLTRAARVIVDRLPLSERIALAAHDAFPREIRLDIALTSFARAVQLQDDAKINRLSQLLVTLLPQVAADWRRIATTPRGADKRFAESFVMAKIPSIRIDLADYERPTGTVAQFAGYWVDWRLVPHGVTLPAQRFARAGDYMNDIDGSGQADDTGDTGVDLTCLERCGRSSFVLHEPDFVVAARSRAQAERRYFLTDKPEVQIVPGARWIWDDALAYVAARPQDGRAAETLYRLIRVARWGGSHDHLGRRAFRLLHARYPASIWAKRSPYWYE